MSISNKILRDFDKLVNFSGSSRKSRSQQSLSVAILGCRGIPAKHGGFETFAERLALYLTSIGWQVTVYCEANNSSEKHISEQYWQNIKLVQIPVKGTSSLSTIIFDWKSTFHARNKYDVVLTLGYNTAIFSLLYRLYGITNIINMDGVEWSRQKWSLPAKIWLYINERFGCWFGNHLIADHPEIKNHLATRVASTKITVIPYGAEPVDAPNSRLLEEYGLVAGEYALIIARPEPENNILEIVSAFSQKTRNLKLVVLGNYSPHENDYHKQIIKASSNEVLFLGGIYDSQVVQALRACAKLYIHGHTVGGTNPSLVEALAAGSAVLAHDNVFNYWVAGKEAGYFKNQEDCEEKLDNLLNNDSKLQKMKQGSLDRYHEEFSDHRDVKAYAVLLENFARLSNNRIQQSLKQPVIEIN